MPNKLENGTRVVLGLFCWKSASGRAFRSRTLHHITFPNVLLDATYLHVRRTGPGGQSAGGQVTSMAVVVATG